MESDLAFIVSWQWAQIIIVETGLHESGTFLPSRSSNMTRGCSARPTSIVLGCPLPRKTRFRVLVRLSRTGFSPLGSYRRFLTYIMFVVLLLQACLAQSAPPREPSPVKGRAEGSAVFPLIVWAIAICNS
jgi:hypothetical protein